MLSRQVPGVHRCGGVCLQPEAEAGRGVAAAAGVPAVSFGPGCLPCSYGSEITLPASMTISFLLGACCTYRYHEWYTRALVHGWTHLEVADNDTMCEDAYDKVMCMPVPRTMCCSR